ncbi:MAG: RIP metalloprotease RseP [Bryobacteraceae bacterium]
MLILENLWWLLVLIGVMIMIHELGHYWAARFFDVHVETFSFGFGPRLFGFRKGETDFRFSAILFGGYVKMAGEQPGDSTDDPRGFLAKPRWQRLIIALAGPTMNVVLAIALVTGLFMIRYPKPADPNAPALVGNVLPDSPAAKAGIREGDVIVQLDDLQRPTWEAIVMREVSGANRAFQVTVERRGKRIQTTVTPMLDEKTGIGFAGWADQSEVQIANVSPGMPAEKAGLQRGDLMLAINGVPIRSRFKLQEVIRASGGKPVQIDFQREGRHQSAQLNPVFSDLDGTGRWMIGAYFEDRVVFTRLALPEALAESTRYNVKGATLIYQFLRGLVERRVSAKSVHGPIGIAQLSGEAAREGPFAFVGLMAMVSLNLAVINLLPIPIMDGGVVLMLLIEMMMRRDMSLPVKEMVFKLGFVFLMVVMAFVIYNDIARILPPGVLLPRW